MARGALEREQDLLHRVDFLDVDPDEAENGVVDEVAVVGVEAFRNLRLSIVRLDADHPQDPHEHHVHQ